MATTRRQRFANGQIALMLVTVIVLAAVGALTFELFVVISLIGFMLLTVATAPVNLTPRWRARLKWPILVGVLVFIYLVIQEIRTVSQVVF